MKMAGISRTSALWISLLFFWLSVLSGTEIELRAPTPVYGGPYMETIFAPVPEILSPGRYTVKGEGKRTFSVRHPLAWVHRFYELPSGKWISPELTADENRMARNLPQNSFDFRLAGSVLAGALFLLGAYLLCRGHFPPRWETLLLCTLPVLLRECLMLYELAAWPDVIPAAADDPGYFQVVRDVLDGRFSGPWKFTIGQGFFYLPFVLFTSAKEFYDIAVPFDYFNALVLAPAALVLGFFVLKELKIHRYCAFAAVMLWALWPFFVYHGEYWKDLCFFPFFSLPPSWTGAFNWWNFYAICINGGFNAMSDVPGLCAVLATTLFLLKAPPKMLWLLVIGMAFGFCCLVRINYIFFAPFLACLWFQKAPLSWKFSGRSLLAASAGFLLIFDWQLWVNFHQFGNPLTFGYSLHYLDFAPEKRPAAGFTLHTLLEWRNTKFLIGANLPLFSMGIAGLLFLKERRTRIALTLFAVPLILFFFGYSHTYCDARRFIMAAFLVFPAAFCGCFAPPWSKQKLWVPAAALLVWVLPWAEVTAFFLLFLLCRAVWDLHGERSCAILSKRL